MENEEIVSYLELNAKKSLVRINGEVVQNGDEYTITFKKIAAGHYIHYVKIGTKGFAQFQPSSL